MICKAKPIPTIPATLQKPSTSAADRNDHNERDPAAWTKVADIKVYLRPRRGSEIVAVDQVEGVRYWMIETWGTSDTRQAKSSWRLTFSDRDGITHTLNITAVLPDVDGRWVKMEAQEAV